MRAGAGARALRGGAPEGFRWGRVLLKISGEALAGDQGSGLDPAVLRSVARDVQAVVEGGVELAVVVGGGNYVRGSVFMEELGTERAAADYIGMLATVMNALSLQAALEGLGVPTRVQTSIAMAEVAEPYIRRKATRHLEKGRVVIFGAGTGNPFFTTDTAAALRAAEIDADVVMKATNVDGVYNADPKQHADAQRFEHLSFDEAEAARLGVMDRTAVTMCRENSIPVLVFALQPPGNVEAALRGAPGVGTIIDNCPS